MGRGPGSELLGGACLQAALVLVQPLRARPREGLVSAVDGAGPGSELWGGACLQAGFLGAVVSFEREEGMKLWSSSEARTSAHRPLTPSPPAPSSPNLSLSHPSKQPPCAMQQRIIVLLCSAEAGAPLCSTLLIPIPLNPGFRLAADT